METFDHASIEKKWQKKWRDCDAYAVSNDETKKKCYVLDMFPYPSGEGLHVGHPKGYIATDVYARYMRMCGMNVLHPMGWDAFGLPAENYALKHNIHPGVAVKKNIARFKEQLGNIGFNYDWGREINTTDPQFYKWTQWIFLQLFKKGLAYESYEPINWCPSCKTGLANEDLDGTTCERCGTEIEKKPMRQWVLKITAYADRLLEDLSELPWSESVKEAQRNWIGRSEGALIRFPVQHTDDTLEVFTTRPDTLFGVTYTVVAPDHDLVQKYIDAIDNKDEVQAYVEATKRKTDIERTTENKEKTGVLLKGVHVINPVNKEVLPVFISDYVLKSYGTGAIMAVPAHDERDYAFAKKFSLPVRAVISGGDVTQGPYVGDGTLINSGEFNGLSVDDAKRNIIAFVDGKMTVQYRLQDWVFSRQRYWGEPIPLIHCPKCGVVPVPEEDLPVTLPDVTSYEPTGTGESPLANITSWVQTTCPSCGGEAKRETNTMPQWAGSSWYHLRYIDPKNEEHIVDPQKERYWSSVDVYVGGMEHATRHLIYARFWHKFLYDLGVVHSSEPYQKLYTVGLILAEDGRKMSKRWGNVINPDSIVEHVGADTLRVYEMFMGPFGQAIAWSNDHMVGARRFLERVYGLRLRNVTDGEENKILLHRTIKKVGDDIASFNFNTAISQLMILVNDMEQRNTLAKNEYRTLLLLLAPFAPHLSEELWECCGEGEDVSIHEMSWPTYDPEILTKAERTIVVQVNGKVRASFTVTSNVLEADMVAQAKEISTIKRYLEDSEIIREIVVPKRLINFVVTPRNIIH